MRGRSQGETERIIMLAHQVEAMARQKTLKPLSAYLSKPKAAAKSDGAAAVLAMLTRMKNKQDARQP